MTERLRVLHVGKFYPPHRGGMESHLELLCRRLAAEVEVAVVVSHDGRQTVRETVDGVPVTRVGTLATLASASVSPGLVRAIRSHPADVVHFHHPNPTAVLAYLASGHPGRLVVTYHSDIVRQRVLGALFEPVLHRFLGRADAILASSPDYAASSPVLRRHGERVHVVPFGIDAEAFATPPAGAAALRARYGPRMVLAVGRLVYYKGFDYLVRAMAGVDAPLVIVGDGPLRGALERLAREVSVAERVHFAGAVPDLAPYYHAAALYAFPSVARSEAFGIAQLEAMACGVPVVNTALETGVPFVSPHGVTGLTVPPADASALAEALRTLLAAPALRAKLGDAARARATGELSAGAMVRRTLDVYHAVTRRLSPLEASE